MAKLFEISANLYTCENYAIFKQTVLDVYQKFKALFGEEVLHRIPLYIDNCTEGGGYTPSSFPVLDSFVEIKLKIADFTRVEQTTYQCAHEMTHFTYRCLLGIKKKQANTYEESICSAMSLCFLYGNCKNFESWCEHVKKLTHEGYRKGYEVALSCGFDPARLRNKILRELPEYRKIAI